MSVFEYGRMNVRMDTLLNRTAVATAHQFENDTARDAYFTAHADELTDRLFIGVGSGYQQYIDETWVAKTAIVAPILTAENYGSITEI